MAKYKEIYGIIKDRIQNNFYLEQNNKLPDEISLCKEFHCSRMTVKHALELLVSEGLIYRRPRQGSFIMNQVNTDVRFNLMDSNLEGFTRSSSGAATSKVLSFELIFAEGIIAKSLNIKEGDPIYDIYRVRFIHNTPYLIEHTYMPVSVIPGLTKKILSNSIYQYIENTLGLKIQSSKKTLRADKASPLDCQVLAIKEDDPILEVEQLAYLSNGVPFEYSFTRHRYDKFQYTSFAIRK